MEQGQRANAVSLAIGGSEMRTFEPSHSPSMLLVLAQLTIFLPNKKEYKLNFDTPAVRPPPHSTPRPPAGDLCGLSACDARYGPQERQKFQAHLVDLCSTTTRMNHPKVGCATYLNVPFGAPSVGCVYGLSMIITMRPLCHCCAQESREFDVDATNVTQECLEYTFRFKYTKVR